MYGMPVSVWTLELIGVIGILATTCIVLYRSALVAGVDRRAAVIVSAVAASGFGGWLVVSALWHEPTSTPPIPGRPRRGSVWQPVVFSSLCC